MPSIPVQIAVIKAVLQTIFDQMDGMFITEEEIYRSYEIEMRKSLDDELQPLNMSLSDFMRQNFRNEFNVIDDPDMRSYMRRSDYFDHVSANRAITGQTSSKTDSYAASPPSQRQVNGSGQANADPDTASQSRQSSSTPAPIPAHFSSTSTRPAASRSEVNGAPPGSSQSGKDVEELQRRFEEQGLGDENNLQPARSAPDIEELNSSASQPSQSAELLKTDNFLDETIGIVESAPSSIYGDPHEQSVPAESSTDFAAPRDGFPVSGNDSDPQNESDENGAQPPPGFEAPSRKTSSNSPGFEAPPRKTSNNLNRAESPRKTSDNLKHDETPAEHEPITKPKNRRGIPFPLSNYDAGFPIQRSSLFYTIVQGSINNSMDVNGYRERYQQYVEENSDLYRRIPEFNWLTGYHLSVNPDTEGYMANNAFIIDVLQLYAEKYPNGMTLKDLISLENVLCGRNQPVCLGRSTNIASVAEMVERGMIYFDGKVYRVHDEIVSINLWKLPPGLTSNLYRILNAQQVTTIQEVVNYTGILNQADGTAVEISDLDIVRQANMFPLVFMIIAQAGELQNVPIARIKLHPKLPRWKVLLDQPTAIKSGVPFHCSCDKCSFNENRM